MEWTKTVKKEWSAREEKKAYEKVLGKAANNETLTEEDLVNISKVVEKHPE
ncbi:hypothetical protein V2U36_05615 [Streptococcus agalactiae]